MADRSDRSDESRFRETKPGRSRSRFKESDGERRKRSHRSVDESVFIEAAELDSVYHHVDQLGEGTERIAFREKGDLTETEMDMTPMVDVTFLLLIFFMVTAAFNLQKSLDVPTPRPDQPSQNVQQRDPQEDPDTVTVHVDRFNTYRVVTTDWDVEAPSEMEMLLKVREACQGNSRGRKPNKLLVMASPEALHQKVIAALDAGSEVGMDKVQLMIVEDED